ncbi:GAF domain-containing protein [Arenibacter sp. GZD96]|uniref:GAF domain-containing protein n=1 Tax=Aurantibrevibacter litoralis TaxID=3106030 RepID=UPI002AFFBA7B|nr:GAF domain-containing protein [Arenibacter sp. GZD-96]MEA1785535.1 GAF domain-containing protein [Arenibacter sp. GZD-96]
MKQNYDEIELPIKQLISFNKLVERYEHLAKGSDVFWSRRARHILEMQAPYPELREGFTDLRILDTHADVIRVILQDTFSELLQENEIKVAALPYNNVIFNGSKRFQQILAEAGPNFEPKISNQEHGPDYIMACTVILNFYYGYKLDFKRPYFYSIPDRNGVTRHYRILYNADFMEILPTEKAIPLTPEDIDELLENQDNLALWKEKFPPGSYIARGFVISNMFDVTAEHSISEIKSSLIANSKWRNENFLKNIEETFRSFFAMPDIKVGFAVYNPKLDSFERAHDKDMDSYLLCDSETDGCHKLLCNSSYDTLLHQQKFYIITDVEKYYELSQGKAPYKNLFQKGVKSAIFAPVVQEGQLLGVLELVSKKVNALNSINATKLLDVMPFIASAVQRSKIEEENLIDAIIQKECTSVHPAVYWHFQQEAKRFILEEQGGGQPSFKEIAFKNVYPLYGQTDISGSSQARNKAIQRDLMIELSEINHILSTAWHNYKLPVYEELMFRVGNHIDAIKEVLHTNSEQAIFDFVKDEINPVFEHLKDMDETIREMIETYESHIDSGTESYYDHRRNYDESVMLINKKLASILDKRQVEAQAMYPHYFERFKTDGVEHNMYIGNAITQKNDFNPLFINNLRLWQLQVICEMENAYYTLKSKLPIQLDVTSLILVYNTSLSIRFRMDEKRFDVDGTYNARYEVIKKRIDKSYIKGTTERLSQPGKLAIVYSQKKDELEYLRYIQFLKAKGYLGNHLEIVELDGLQGVSGLKAIRVEILYSLSDADNKVTAKTYSYQDLMDELKF